jgi:methyl-accepting chemotaxis protein PixJ
MSLQSVPGGRIGGWLARLRCWTLRTKLATALALVGTMPTLLTVYIGHVPWWIVAAPLLVVGLMTMLLMRLLMAPIMSLKATIERVQAGDFTARSGIDQRDEIGEIAVAFDAMTERAQALIDELEAQRLDLENGIIRLFTELARAANGDLTVRPTLSESSLGAVADSVSVLLKRFSTIVRNIQATAHEVSSGTLQVAHTVQQVSHEATRQATALATSAQAMGDLSASAAGVSQRTQAAMTVSARALDAVRSGHDAVARVHDTMGGIRDTTRRATRKVKALGESAQLMSQALSLVQRNTEELHIVAGNASIEAARHAENGGIFRTVADSIEVLAEQSQLALRQIQDVIARNQHETVGVVEAIEDVTAEVAAGARTVQSAAKALSVVDGVVQELADLNVFIASASSEQARQAAALATMMGTLNGISLETSRTTAASADAAVRLRQLTNRLTHSVATLKVS